MGIFIIFTKNFAVMARYPIGKQNFRSIREGGYVYVDKTMYIPKLLEGANYYFLARPRRFGKSLFLSTLESFFQGERELFKDLAIANYNWDWSPYPVIHIDLNGANYTKGTKEFIDKLEYQLEIFETKYGVTSHPLNISLRFQNLITNLYDITRKPVVVLVDEYEKPVLDTIDNPELNENYMEILRGFYSCLKSMDRYLQLVFLTGVTKLGRMSIFSGLNNIRDISMDRGFSSVCGLTEVELTENFKEGIEALSLKKKIDFKSAVNMLKENYDGYHFCEECPDIYNPYSIINALENNKIEDYWASTGTPSILAKMLLTQNIEIKDFSHIKTSGRRLQGIGNNFDDPVALFYQTGYLTIKGYDEDEEIFTLGFPNKEVEQAFFEYLLPSFSNKGIVDADSFIISFRKSLRNGEADKAMEVLKEFSAGLSYDVIPQPDIERHFQNLIYIICKLVLSKNVHVKVEEKTSDGRIDLLILTDRFIYIVEIKRDISPESALKQIEDKEYALQFRSDPRKAFLIGINFSTVKRRIDGYVISEIN